jgi:tetratricopeptide (TPR) repeat protein
MLRQYPQAIKCFDEANALNPQDTNPMFGKTLCLSIQGEFTSALKTIKQTIIQKPDDATLLQLMADIEESLGNIDNAILICERILQLSQDIVDERTKKLAFQITKLKKILGAKQRLAELPKKQLNKQAHVTALANLAAAYQNINRYKEAEQFLGEAIEITRNQLGSDSPYLTPLFNNLATVFQAQHKFDQAQAMYEQAIGIIEDSYGPEDRNLGPCYTNLATVLDDQGLYAQAQLLYVRALAIKEHEFGPQHPSLIPTLMSYATSLRKARLFADADKCDRRVALIQQMDNH